MRADSGQPNIRVVSVEDVEVHRCVVPDNKLGPTLRGQSRIRQAGYEARVSFLRANSRSSPRPRLARPPWEGAAMEKLPSGLYRCKGLPRDRRSTRGRRTATRLVFRCVERRAVVSRGLGEGRRHASVRVSVARCAAPPSRKLVIPDPVSSRLHGRRLQPARGSIARQAKPRSRPAPGPAGRDASVGDVGADRFIEESRLSGRTRLVCR
jgi:hypothetical protein